MKNNPCGTLYVVATPIGNAEDITLRAIRVLGSVRLIAAEDTRNTAHLLASHHIRTPLISCHEYNERKRAKELMDRIKSGDSVALVSDAGTPSVSDPGYRIVKEAVANDIPVVPIPGVSAVMTAISVSGLPTDSFIFIGFPDKKKEKRLQRLRELAADRRTLAFYESPKRIVDFIDETIHILGDRYAFLAREMTKRHEEYIRGNLSHILSELKKRPFVKGECTLLISGCETTEIMSTEDLQDEIITELEKHTIGISELSKQLSERFGMSRRLIYKEILNASAKLK